MCVSEWLARQRRLCGCGWRCIRSWAGSFGIALAVALVGPQGALAAIATTLVEIPISPAAVAVDPLLAGYRSFDLRIVVPPGLSWGYTGFLAELTQGSFYNPTLGHQIPLPQLWGAFPNLRYDTFVTQAADPDDDTTFVGPFLQHGYPEYPAPIEFTDLRTSVVYLSNYGVFTGPGIFTIGRLTFSADAVGSIEGFTESRGGGNLMTFEYPIPEPLAMNLLLFLAGGSLLHRSGPAGRASRFANLRLCLCTLVLLTLAAPPASAAISSFLAPVPISPAAVAADPNLAGHQTWDLRIDVPKNQRWGFSGFDAILLQGSFYNSPLGGNTPSPQLWGLFPQLRFDTFVTQAADPDDDSTFIPPTITSGFPEPPLPVIFNDTRISIVYHGAPGPGFGPGILTTARLTFSDDAAGTIVGHSVDRATGETTPFAFTIPIPEPTSSLVGLTVVALLARRSRGFRLQGGIR